MLYVATKDLSNIFLSDDIANEVTQLDQLARESLSEHGYIGISVPGNDLASVEFTFDCPNHEDCLSALDAIIASYSGGALLSLKLEIFKKINDFRDAWMDDYFPYDGKRWDCDNNGRLNVMGMVLKGVSTGLSPGEVFRDKDNNNVPVTLEYIFALGAAYFEFRKATYYNSWLHKYMVGIQPTAEAVLAYNYSAGWPSKDPV